MNIKVRIVSYLAIFAAVFGVGYVSGNSGANVSAKEGLVGVIGSQANNEKRINFETFNEVWDNLFLSYVNEDKLDKKKMAYGAIKGMTEALNDPYTVFMDPEETEKFNNNLNSVLEGIGCELSVKDQMLTVVSTLKDSPAKKAGVLSGDVIYKIDGESTADMTIYEALTKIRGEKGSSVVLTLLRKNVEKPFEIKIIRDAINIESVRYFDKGKGILINENDEDNMYFRTGCR